MADSRETCHNLTIAEGKSLNVRNTMELHCTDGSIINFGAGGTVLSTATLAALPSTNPHVVGALWLNSGVVSVSAG